RARRAGRRELDDPHTVIEGEVGVQPPTETAVEALGAIDVRHRNDYDFQLGIDSLSGRGFRCLFIADLCGAHRNLRGSCKFPGMATADRHDISVPTRVA